MTLETYTKLADALLAEAQAIETAKRPAYTQGSVDVLANFRRIAERTGLTPGQVLTVYLLKHLDSITAALCQPTLPQAETVVSRFADAVNYLKLGFALLEEGQLPMMAQYDPTKESTAVVFARVWRDTPAPSLRPSDTGTHAGGLGADGATIAGSAGITAS
jgi:hypothetical protein